MRKRLTIVTAVAASATALAIPMFASGATGITANLTGAQVVNPSGGDPDGSAKVAIRVNRVKARLCFRLKESGLSTMTGAFVHKGAAGQIARPIITLFNTRESGSYRACEHNVRPRLIKRLKRKPGLHYVDITTKQYPNGAVRGQFK